MNQPFPEELVEETHAPNGGYVDSRNLDLLQGDEAQIMLNMNHDRLDVGRRQGIVQIGQTLTDTVCYGGFHYRQKDDVHKLILRVQGTKLYRGTGGQWYGAQSGQPAANSSDVFGSGANLGCWIQYADRVYYFDGGTTRKYFDGENIKTAGAFAGATLPKGRIIGENTGGSLSAGGYRYVYTYYNPTTAEESNPSEASDVISVAANSKFAIFIPKNPEWVAAYGYSTIRVYRTTAGGATYLFDFEVTGVERLDILDHYMGVCSRADANLGTAVSYDNGQIPQMRYAILFNEMVVGAGDPDDPSTVYWSAQTQPTRFPPQNALDLDKDNGDPISGIFRLLGRVYVLKQTSGIYMLSPSQNADGDPIFTYEPITSDWGCISHHSIVVIDTYAYWADTKGICRFNGQQVENISDPKIRETWRRLANGAAITRCVAVHDRRADKQYYRLTVHDPDDGFCYDLIYDVSQNAWFKERPASEASGRGNRVSWLVKDTKGQYVVMHGDNTGRAFCRYRDLDGNAVYADCGEAIDSQWKSREWGGMDGVMPLYVDIEYERSRAGQYFGTPNVNLYRDGASTPAVTDTTSIIPYAASGWFPPSSQTDVIYPQATMASHTARVHWNSAEWCRRFSFDVSTTAKNCDLRILAYRICYKRRGRMLAQR